MARVWLASSLPAASRRSFERRQRGREQVAMLRRADAAVVSYGKAGRTWLRVMLSGYYQRLCGLPERSLIGFANYHRRDARVPRIFFTHDNYIVDFTGHRGTKRDFYGTKVVLLVRSPQDTAVSQYFQWKHRMRRAKRELNDYPTDDATSMFDFVMSPGCGLPKIVDFMNLWAAEHARVARFLAVRYEDMRRDPEAELLRVVGFLDGSADVGCVAHAVAFASVDNMRAMEERKGFWLAGRRMRPGDRANPDSYKVRRAKVGGYRDQFDAEQIARIDELVSAKLSPLYGYGAGGVTGPATGFERRTP
ncbi:MAG TPA: sulfotransferase domain-containing protein [Myxococcota bacterium]|nr:sulfotransferase domain-containing protein [Myxococcota bacterium]